MTYKPGTLVKCVKRGPWINTRLGVGTGPEYDDRLVVQFIEVRGSRTGLGFAEYPKKTFWSRFFRPVVFTGSEQTTKTREPVT